MGGFEWTDRRWVGSDGQIGVHHAAPPISHSQIRSSGFFFFFFCFCGVGVVGFFFFCFFWVWFDGWVGRWVGSNGQIGGGWVRMGRSASTTQHRPSHTLRSDRVGFSFFFFVFVVWGWWGFFFFVFFGCGLMVGLGDGWVRMDRSAVGGFGWADRRPPRSTAHLTLSDQIEWVFLFFFLFLWCGGGGVFFFLFFLGVV